MNYEEFKKYLKSENTDNNIFVLFGEEDFLKTHSKKELIEKIGPKEMPEFNVFIYEGKKYDLTSVKEAIELLPVFSETKLLIFNNSGVFQLAGREAATKEYREFWEEMIEEIPDNVYIIFDENKVDKRSALFKKMAKRNSNSLVEFSYLSEEKMLSWTAGVFKKLNKSIIPKDAKYLIEITQEGMTAVKREAEKIAAYAENAPVITKEIIDAVVVPVVENRVFDMVDAILAKDTTAALKMLNDLLILKEEETKILGAISSSVDKLLTVKLLADEKIPRESIASSAKIAPFIVSKYINLSKKHSDEDVKALLTKCVEIDRIFKSERCDKAVVLETFIVEFTQNK